LFLLSDACLWAQDVVVTHDGFVSLFGEKPYANIRADNHEVEGILHTKTGEVEFHTLVKSFHFKNKAIEKPFNEKYMESGRYPKTDFVGKILNFADIDFHKPGTYSIMVEGNLTIHNITRWVSHPAILTVTENELIAKSQFTVKPSAFRVKVPRLLGIKLITEINVAVDMNFVLQDIIKKD
jgi:hypothetical protein